MTAEWLVCFSSSHRFSFLSWKLRHVSATSSVSRGGVGDYESRFVQLLSRPHWVKQTKHMVRFHILSSHHEERITSKARQHATSRYQHRQPHSHQHIQQTPNLKISPAQCHQRNKKINIVRLTGTTQQRPNRHLHTSNLSICVFNVYGVSCFGVLFSRSLCRYLDVLVCWGVNGYQYAVGFTLDRKKTLNSLDSFLTKRFAWKVKRIWANSRVISHSSVLRKNFL